MDNNVSKNTFSHNFFKVRFTQEQTSISVKSLLAKRLLQTLNLYQQKLHLQLDLKFFSTIINDKIILSSSARQILASANQGNQISSKLYITPIVYTSPIALVLANYLLLSPVIIAENLVKLLTLNQNNSLSELSLQLEIEITPSGWLNFYLDSATLANWLKQVVFFLEAQYPVPVPVPVNVNQANPTSTQLQEFSNLMPLQYAHARCCSLLRLGARAKLITLKDDCFTNTTWQLEYPQSISWLDEQQNFCLIQESEYDLLRQLLIVTDAFAEKPDSWVKLAFDLTIASEIFQAECRFLGEVKQQTPQIAIARLGLIALVQYWLQRILVEKLNVVALSSL